MNTQVTQNVVGAHLVGGLFAPDAETAMRTTARILGRHLRAITDGETGDRSRWIGWNRVQLLKVDGIEATGPPGGSDARFRPMTSLAIDPSLTSLPPGSIGYATAAAASYPIFCRLRDEGVLAPDMKFQVAIPTAKATVTGWTRLEDQERFLPIYSEALAADVRAIVDVIGDDLLLQYDVATEFALLVGEVPAAGDLADEKVVLDDLRNELRQTPDGVEYGIHLCYGDLQHRHFFTPQDLGQCVKIANAVGDGCAFIHMPADRETGTDPKYFEPLRGLNPVPLLSLGVVDYEGEQQRTEALIEAAVEGSGGMEFAIATECGMARIDERGPGGPSLEDLLELHARNAAPLAGR